MRLQKSVYYMTDSELRAYKRRKRRQRIIRNRILTLLITISMVKRVMYFTLHLCIMYLSIIEVLVQKIKLVIALI